jgi:hypothetical protein
MARENQGKGAADDDCRAQELGALHPFHGSKGDGADHAGEDGRKVLPNP